MAGGHYDDDDEWIVASFKTLFGAWLWARRWELRNVKVVRLSKWATEHGV